MAKNKHIKETKPKLDHHLRWLGVDRAPKHQRERWSASKSLGDKGGRRSSTSGLSMRNKGRWCPNGLQDITKTATALELDELFITRGVSFRERIEIRPIRGRVRTRGKVFKFNDRHVGDGSSATVVLDS
jgi:hypothetical protein